MHNDREHERNFPLLDYLNRVVTANLANVVTVWDENTNQIAQEKLFGFIDYEIVAHGNYLPIVEEYDLPDESFIKEELNVEGYESIYLYTGAIREYKGVPDLIQSFKEVFDGSTLLVILGNPWNEEIKKEVSDLVEGQENIKKELEYVEDERMLKYYKIAEWAVFPYKHIFNSGSIFFAMSAGTPFIAPDMGSIPSFKDHNLVYSNGELKDALSSSQKFTKAQIKKKGEDNLQVISEEYDYSLTSSKLLDVYRGR